MSDPNAEEVDRAMDLAWASSEADIRVVERGWFLADVMEADDVEG